MNDHLRRGDQSYGPCTRLIFDDMSHRVTCFPAIPA